MRFLQKLWNDERGNTAIIFGLAAIPLVALGGGTVDFANRAKVRGEMQTAADTAAIAAARVLQLGQLARDPDIDALRDEARQKARQVLDATLARLGGADAVNVVINVDDAGGGISVATSFDVDTTFLGVVGINNLPATATSEVNLPEPILMEIAMVLDYSGSMRDDDKYIRMTDAARSFISRVESDRGGTSKIGIVPFSEYVYTNMASAYVRDDDGGYHFGGSGSWGWGGWGGSSSGSDTYCLLNRGYPYSATDQAPSSGLPESQWPEGSDSRCDAYATNNLRLRDLTDEFSQLSDSLASMQPVGLTNISLGMEMGWHMLTPDAPFTTARDFSDTAVRKILILLTDGMQTVPAEGPSGGPSVEAANETTAELCDSAKSTNIRVFSIAYDVSDPAVESLLLNCATGAQSYFDASVSEIGDVFDEIYSQIAESVWVSK